MLSVIAGLGSHVLSLNWRVLSLSNLPSCRIKNLTKVSRYTVCAKMDAWALASIDVILYPICL